VEIEHAPSTAWVASDRARVGWAAATGANGAVKYGVILDGQLRVSGLNTLSYLISSKGLGEGLHHVQVQATDSAGQQTISTPEPLRVDVSAPKVSATRLSRHRLRIRVSDSGSGVNAKSVKVKFGDGRSVHGSASVTHAYRAAGRRTVTVLAADNVGHKLTRTLKVQVR
jgi:hypothetical protein